jgi:subtilisin-like proprotein convertase family protein
LDLELDWSAAGGSSGTTALGLDVLGADFALVSHSLDDLLMGDGNGMAGPGETVDLFLTLENTGRHRATEIEAVLSTSSPYITLLDDTAAYPDLAQGGQGMSLPSTYRFSVAPDAPDGQRVNFVLDVSEQGGGWREQLPLELTVADCWRAPSSEVPLDILDHQLTESSLSVGLDAAVEDVQVFVDIGHSYIGDLTVTLVSPQGTSCLLHNRSGEWLDEIVTWYDSETQPAEPLSVFDGEQAAGVWRLLVEDHADNDTGSLRDWTLEICSANPGGVPGEIRPLMLTKQGADGLLQWPGDSEAIAYRVWRAADPSSHLAFADVTAEDVDPTDLEFLDRSGGSPRYYIVQGLGAGGDGPWGRYGR